MADPLVLAIDIGTSAVRSAIVDRKGGVAASVRVERDDESAGTRFDVQQLWADVADSITRLPAESKSNVVSLCIAGHVGTVFVDAAGSPVGSGLGWADSSGASQLAEAAGGALPALLQETGRVSTGGGAATAFFDLRGTRPAEADRVACVLTPKDFVILCLTGQRATDLTSAAYSGLSAIASGSWSRGMLDLVGLDSAQLPAQLGATDIVGTVLAPVAEELGLPSGVVVVAGATDGSVGAALVLRQRQDLIADIAGTTDVLLHLVETPSEARARSVVNPYPLGGYSAGGPTGATGAALARWAALLGLDGVGAATDLITAELGGVGRGAGGLMIDPSFSGRRFPHWQPGAAGMVRGQRADHGAVHFILAAAEGAAHIVRDAVDALDPTRRSPIVLAGGAARSRTLTQLRADVLGRAVEVCDEPDVSLLGAGLLALAGWGGDVEEFEAGARRSIVRPDPAAADEYAALHATWLHELGFDTLP